VPDAAQTLGEAKSVFLALEWANGCELDRLPCRRSWVRIPSAASQMSALQLRLSRWLSRRKKRNNEWGVDNDDRPFGTADDLFDIGAHLHEHGCFLMMRQLKTIAGEGAFEDVPARFRAENGSPGVALWLGDDLYLFRIDDLEAALSNPAPSAQEDFPLSPEDALSREACQEVQGCVLMVRWAEEVKDQELFEPMPGRFVVNEWGSSELLVGGERYVFRPGDLWDSLTDPRTYRRDDEGPFPIDALRDPPSPR
jgi:hypothetical protein